MIIDVNHIYLISHGLCGDLSQRDVHFTNMAAPVLEMKRYEPDVRMRG